jgi:uncharacterized membrane protein YheB (UPF0754 family)
MKKSELRQIIREEIKRLIENKTIWYIQKWDEDGDEKTVNKYTTFDKNKIQKDFDKIAKSLKPEEEVHFMKDDSKYVGEYILSVVNLNGKLSREVTKGSKVYYRPYNIKDITE